MTIRRLLTASASLALAFTGIVAANVGSWEASAAQATAVVVSTQDVPTRAATADQTTNARVSTPAPMRRRFRSRTTSHDPVAVMISLILVAVIMGGYWLFRYLSSQGKARQSPTMSYNGPSGPQYGVTAGSYGGPQYPQSGASMHPPMQTEGGYPAGQDGNYYGQQQGGYPAPGMYGTNGTYGSFGAGY